MSGNIQRYSHSVQQLFRAVGSYLKVLLLSRFRTPEFRKIAGSGGEIVVLGNGPSVNGFLARHRGFLSGREVMCVNRAAVSEAYTEIKPRFYVVIDPINFREEEYRKQLFGPLAEKTEWELFLFVPFRYRKVPGWKEMLRGNPNIRIVYINVTPADGSFRMVFPLMKKRLAMPRPRNVLTPALMCSVWMGFRTVYAAGVEHSWHRELWVNDRNELMINDTHFYDGNTDRNIRHGAFTMATILESLRIAFASYGEVRKFAERMDCRIWNVTEGSFIDAFERKKL